VSWNYLATSAFKTRYAIAAYIIDESRCDNVVEIGGYKTPIFTFLHNSYDMVIAHDPIIIETVVFMSPVGWISLRPGYFQDYVNYMPKSNFGLVCLGMEIKGDFEPFIELVNRSTISVIEFPPDFEPSLKQFEQLMAETTKEINMCIKLDLSNNDFSGLTGYPVRPRREMYVLK